MPSGFSAPNPSSLSPSISASGTVILWTSILLQSIYTWKGNTIGHTSTTSAIHQRHLHRSPEAPVWTGFCTADAKVLKRVWDRWAVELESYEHHEKESGRMLGECYHWNSEQVLGTSGKELQEDPGEWERITFFHPFHHFTQRQLCYAKAHWLGRLETQTIRSRKSL